MDRVEQEMMQNSCGTPAFREAAVQSFAGREHDAIGGGSERNVHQASSRARRAARWVHVVLLVVALGCMSSAFAQPTALPLDPPAPPIPVEQMRAFGYTKEFAKRFALPEPEPGWEPGEGLLAVEFRVQPIPGGRGLYACDFKLYLDGKLDIAFPEPGRSGASELYTSRTHTFIARDKAGPDVSPEDAHAHFARQKAFLQLVAIATSDYVAGAKGALTSSPLLEFVRDLFPEVNYVMASDCMFASWLSRRESGLKIWLKKSTGKDYTRTAMRDPDDFYKFPLPPALIAKARPWAEWVSANSSWVHSQEAKKQRERNAGTFRQGAGKQRGEVVEPERGIEP